MKKIIIFILSLLLLISLTANIRLYLKPQSQNSNLNGFISGQVIRVIDGDTFDVVGGDRIRLLEIDAPEYPSGCLGIDAKTRLEDLIFNKNVRYAKAGKDIFGRVLAYVFMNNVFINEIMIEEGLAYYFKGKTQTNYSLGLEQSQEKAKAVGRGVWSNLCQTKKEGCLIKGNYRSADNTRLYHTPDCYNYDRITIKPGTSDRWFCTEKEAVMAGYVKSLDCPK